MPTLPCGGGVTLAWPRRQEPGAGFRVQATGSHAVQGASRWKSRPPLRLAGWKASIALHSSGADAAEAAICNDGLGYSARSRRGGARHHLPPHPLSIAKAMSARSAKLRSPPARGRRQWACLLPTQRSSMGSRLESCHI
jgi:hypothetical protein